MRKFIALVLVLAACGTEKKQIVDQTTIDFSTTDASKLFFKNVRQIYYDKEELSAAKLDLFRLKKRNESSDWPVLNLVIVNNWRYDEAYVLVEPNTAFDDAQAFQLYWSNNDGSEQGLIEFKKGDKQDIQRFCNAVYYQLVRGSRFRLDSKEGMEILMTRADREAFRVTMVDYYRLTERASY